ncbi:hypothetical protein [Brevibacillus fortis]|uniref:Uncharacterized protein n=1 Tax=Brevibacillus fortis TaxID=2126352 RepID=A0A2P7V5T5_9BACL|nr:hypothetical protein [Brevibacillus fortis]PSJ94571.1 hypothetical protein C7R93_14360 [Brevibacillus fortis]
MLSLNHPTMEAISLVRNQLIQAIVQHQTKPYLPVWGELFTALREIQKAGQHSQKNIHVYSIEPTGDLWYLYRENVFSVDLPGIGITISLTPEQFIDAFLKGSFQPTLSITEPS